jgi:hypothetical protein
MNGVHRPECEWDHWAMPSDSARQGTLEFGDLRGSICTGFVFFSTPSWTETVLSEGDPLSHWVRPHFRTKSLRETSFPLVIYYNSA